VFNIRIGNLNLSSREKTPMKISHLINLLLFLMILLVTGCDGNSEAGGEAGALRDAFGPAEDNTSLPETYDYGPYRYVDRYGAAMVFELDGGVIVNGSIYGESGAYEGTVTGGVYRGLILFTLTCTTGTRRGISCSYRAKFGSTLDTVYVGNGSEKDICWSSCNYPWRQQ
jgi:hypothetical protein